MKVNLSVCNDGSLLMTTNSKLDCLHFSPSKKIDEISSNKDIICNDFLLSTKPTSTDTKSLMTFRVKSGKVEAEQTANLWAGQCQSKV